MTGPLTVVAVVACPGNGATSLAAEMSLRAARDALPSGVEFPTDASWFGAFPDSITVHPELVELSGGVRADDGHTEPGEESTPRVHVAQAGDTPAAMRPRPSQSRPVVRDRLRRVADDARERGTHTLVFVVPQSAWSADPNGLRRELARVADHVTIVLAADVLERVLARALARAALEDVRRGNPMRSRSARTALATGNWIATIDSAAAYDRWLDPESSGTVRTVLAVCTPPTAAALLRIIGHTSSYGDPEPDPASPALDDTTRTPRVSPPPSRSELDQLAELQRLAKNALLPRTRRERRAELDRALIAVGRAGLDGASADEPFTFTEAERHLIRRRLPQASEFGAQPWRADDAPH
ncbi:hypothetical protein EV141_0304 [Microcella putealis]|uniref:Uncharacterized protein n=1 Tax=Microcella putealis TaxID=337005 RepID=A0A4Q7LX78_9MICO|nr:hypothetical protein [Microcella putealis]RZS59087.1 hypothetical protein EV141_0304 [Microcella putealis]TQM24113.1 hypothetical protein BJ957_1583 [Microcella putealis]